MAHRAPTLYIRITKNGKSSFCKPVYQSKGRLKPQYAIVEGEPKHHKEGVYYVRFGSDGGKQQFVLVGKDPYIALDKLEEKKRWLRDRERQVVPQTPSKPETSRLTMDDAVEQYHKNLHSQGKDPKTIRAYKVCGRGVPQVLRQEILERDWQAGLDRLHGMASEAAPETAERRHAP